MVSNLTAKETLGASPTRNGTRPVVNPACWRQKERSILKKDLVIESTVERDMTRAGAMICQLTVNTNLLATADKMMATVKIMFSYSINRIK